MDEVALTDEQAFDVLRYDPSLLNLDESMDGAKHALRSFRQRGLWDLD